MIVLLFVLTEDFNICCCPGGRPIQLDREEMEETRLGTSLRGMRFFADWFEDADMKDSCLLSGEPPELTDRSDRICRFRFAEWCKRRA